MRDEQLAEILQSAYRVSPNRIPPTLDASQIRLRAWRRTAHRRWGLAVSTLLLVGASVSVFTGEWPRRRQSRDNPPIADIPAHPVVPRIVDPKSNLENEIALEAQVLFD